MCLALNLFFVLEKLIMNKWIEARIVNGFTFLKTFQALSICLRVRTHDIQDDSAYTRICARPAKT